MCCPFLEGIDIFDEGRMSLCEDFRDGVFGVSCFIRFLNYNGVILAIWELFEIYIIVF
jgi:hypothetical protein